MKTAKVVIGANYGDEGKGLTTDFLASKLGPETVVVRFNGGSQAGHTVQRPDGTRHVFGHFGSGSFVGCPTHLSSDFITNPVTFLKELKVLKEKGLDPKVTVSPDSIVTFPFDMVMNQVAQKKQGVNSSCGMGINETVTRCENKIFKLTVSDLVDPDLKDKLYYIRKCWLEPRIQMLELKSHFEDHHNMICFEDSFLDKFIEESKEFLSNVLVIDDEYLSNVDNIIFEGAQGLLLDQNHKNYPYVTRSNTGIQNVCMMAEAADVTNLDVYYVTRTYLTRHGDGPLPNESKTPIFRGIEDKTNIPNKFQGTLRFALLDPYVLLESIRYDLGQSVNYGIGTTSNLMITCIDQITKEKNGLTLGGINYSAEDVVNWLKYKFNNFCESRGPCREHVRSNNPIK